ncbi:MAG: tetratricopeptide repeat protein [Thermoanaerobaculia bacterium]
MRRQRVAVTALLLLLVAGISGCNKLKAKQEIKKGNEFARAQQYQTALASYQEALRLDPNEKRLHKSIGYAYMGMYQPGSKHVKDLEIAGKAIEHLKIYVDTVPEDRKAREVLLSMYLATERYDEAVGFYQAMLKEDPKDTRAMGSMASIYFKRGDFDQGVEWLKRRIAAEPPDTRPEVYHLIGAQAWDRSYNYPNIDPMERARIVDQGLEALNEAMKLRPDYFEALSYINLLYREKAKMETDPVRQQEYIAQADQYRAQAMEMRKKALAAAAPTPTVAEPKS